MYFGSLFGKTFYSIKNAHSKSYNPYRVFTTWHIIFVSWCLMKARFIFAGHKDVVSLLMKHGATLHNRDRLGSTCLLECAAVGDSDMVDLLLSKDDDVNAADISGSTALHRAASAGHQVIIDLLVRHSPILLNIRNDHGNTSLHHAAQNNKINAMISLLNHGADTRIVNISGQSALYLAILHKHTEIVELLATVGDCLTNREIERFSMGSRCSEERDLFEHSVLLTRDTVSSLRVLTRNCIRETIECVSVKKLPLPPLLHEFITLDDYVKID